MIEEAGSEAEGLARFNQEYLVDFDAPVPGAYFGEQMLAAEREGRIGYVPYDSRCPVSTSWDLGMDDYTAIWFWQRVSRTRINAIAYYECSGLGFDDGMGGGIIPEAFAPRSSWKFDLHYLPHDVAVRELGAGGRSRRETLMSLGIRPIRVGVQRAPEERIAASRKLMPIVYYDKENTQAGVDHLKQFRKRWNKLLHQFGGPLHDEHSHGADAYGEFAVNASLPRIVKPGAPPLNPADFGFGKKIVRALNWKVA